MSTESGGLLRAFAFFNAASPLKSTGDTHFYQSAEQRDDPEKKSLLSTIAQGIRRKADQGIDSLQSAYEGTVTAGRRLKFFFLYMLLAALCLFGSSFFLPMVLLFPEKFSMLFSLSGICVHVAMSYLRVRQTDYLYDLCRRDNFPLSACYFGSIVLTLYFSLVSKSYVMVLFCTGIQAICVLWFFFSLFPGGTTGLKAVFRYGLRLICPCGESSLPLPI